MVLTTTCIWLGSLGFGTTPVFGNEVSPRKKSASLSVDTVEGRG